MSSHKEAPGIAKDPAADSTDVYAFVSPDDPDTVTILANYVPLQDPAGGPNFFEFGAKTRVPGRQGVGDDVRYEIHIDNTGSGRPAITYQFLFTTTILEPDTFLYNTGPITFRDGEYSRTWNRPQTYQVRRIDHQRGTTTLIDPGDASRGRGSRRRNRDVFLCPPCNVGVRSTPNYQELSDAATYEFPDGLKIFAGQRAEGFFVDLGSVFDLAALRPIDVVHTDPQVPNIGVNSLAANNVHAIVLQLPISSLTQNRRRPRGPEDPNAVIGVWTAASRQTVRMFEPETGVTTATGPYRQVSRLGNPLVNEVIVPMARKDFWNSQQPADDQENQFVAAVERPEVVRLLLEFYPIAFGNLARYTGPRQDLVQLFLTGIPGRAIGPAFGVGTYQGGRVAADTLRLNMGIAPTGIAGVGTSNLGLLGGDLGGFPNGRRLTDDVVNILLQSIAGATIPWVDRTYTPDLAIPLVIQGVLPNPRAYQATFPYLANPHGGYSNPLLTPLNAPAPAL